MPDLPQDSILAIHVSDGQYRIRADSGMDIDNMWPPTEEGLFVADDNWAAVLCGTEWGQVQLTIRVLDAAPHDVESEWDMVAERSLLSSEGEVTIGDALSDKNPTVITVNSEWTRIRVSVRGREDGARANAAEPVVAVPVERHLIELWPVQHQEPSTVVHGPDEYARSYMQ